MNIRKQDRNANLPANQYIHRAVTCHFASSLFIACAYIMSESSCLTQSTALYKKEAKEQESPIGFRKKDSRRRMQMQTHTSAREQQHILRARNSVRSSHRESPSEEERADEEASRTALSSFRMKEEQIERKKMEIREKVFAQLGRVEEESKRLAVIRKVS